MRALQNTLVENPLAGDPIRGGKGLRKLRAALGSHGKRGGARVIYYWWTGKATCYLVFAYPKNVQANLSPEQLKILADTMQKEVENG